MVQLLQIRYTTYYKQSHKPGSINILPNPYSSFERTRVFFNSSLTCWSKSLIFTLLPLWTLSLLCMCSTTIRDQERLAWKLFNQKHQNKLVRQWLFLSFKRTHIFDLCPYFWNWMISRDFPVRLLEIRLIFEDMSPISCKVLEMWIVSSNWLLPTPGLSFVHFPFRLITYLESSHNELFDPPAEEDPRWSHEEGVQQGLRRLRC